MKMHAGAPLRLPGRSTEVENPAPAPTILERQQTLHENMEKLVKDLKSDDGFNAARTTLVRTLRSGIQAVSPYNPPSAAPQPTHLTPPSTMRDFPGSRESALMLDALSRMAHRVTDYCPTPESEAIRLVRRGLANLRSRDNTRTPNNSPILAHMAHPVPDSADLLDLDAPAYKRLTSRSLLDTMYNRPNVEPEIVRLMKRKLTNLPSHDSTRTSDDDPALVAHPIQDSPGLLGPDAPACKRLISRSLSPEQVISLIEALFTSKEEVAMISDLDGDDAQAFVDVVNEVRSPSSPHLSLSAPSTFTFRWSGSGSPGSSTGAAGEMFESIIPDLRSSCVAPAVVADSALPRSVGHPVVSRWVR